MNIEYKVKDEVYIIGDDTKCIIKEISIKENAIEYSLWKVGTPEFTWMEGWMITSKKPDKIGFKTN